MNIQILLKYNALFLRVCRLFLGNDSQPVRIDGE